MRAIRSFAVAALVALDVNAAAAQSSRQFKDSWFWGLKGGATSYQVQSDPSGLAPMAGADWLITRSQGGLYLSFDHSFFKRDSVFVNDSISPLDTVPRTVILSGLRRFTMAGMLFPMQSYRVHPYIGLGVSLSYIVRAEPLGTFRNNTQANLVQSTVQRFRSTGAPVFILGTQVRLPLASAFVQATTSPTSNNFFLFTGTGWRSTLEAGMRYNTGTSIEKMH